MSCIQINQFCFKNTSYQFRLSTINYKKNSLLHKLIVKSLSNLFKCQKAFFSGCIRKLNNLRYYLSIIKLRIFHCNAESLKMSDKCLKCIRCQHTRQRTTNSNRYRRDINKSIHNSFQCRIGRTRYNSQYNHAKANNYSQ